MRFGKFRKTVRIGKKIYRSRLGRYGRYAARQYIKTKLGPSYAPYKRYAGYAYNYGRALQSFI
jgi:hypothetical protein